MSWPSPGSCSPVLLLVIATVDPDRLQRAQGRGARRHQRRSASGGRSVVRLLRRHRRFGRQLFPGRLAECRAEAAAGRQSRRKLIEAQATELENKRLKALLKLTGETEDDQVAVTRIVGSSFDSRPPPRHPLGRQLLGRPGRASRCAPPTA